MRRMLGQGDAYFDDACYERRMIVRNVALLPPELLNEVNVLIVAAGHEVATKKAGAESSSVRRKWRKSRFRQLDELPRQRFRPTASPKKGLFAKHYFATTAFIANADKIVFQTASVQ